MAFKLPMQEYGLQSKGLGDSIEKITKITGIEKIVKKVACVYCGKEVMSKHSRKGYVCDKCYILAMNGKI